jgi:hypothetical protein
MSAIWPAGPPNDIFAHTANASLNEGVLMDAGLREVFDPMAAHSANGVKPYGAALGQASRIAIVIGLCRHQGCNSLRAWSLVGTPQQIEGHWLDQRKTLRLGDGLAQLQAGSAVRVATRRTGLSAVLTS